jgi:hypothetical protein
MGKDVGNWTLTSCSFWSGVLGLLAWGTVSHAVALGARCCLQSTVCRALIGVLGL